MAEAERCLGGRGARDQAPSPSRAVHARSSRGPAAGRDRRRATLPVLIHAGRGIPALGLHAVELAEDFPNARLILAHAGICDLSLDLAGRRRIIPNLLFDTAWWMPADLQALFIARAAGPDPVRHRRPLRHHRVRAGVPAPLGAPGRAQPEQVRSISFRAGAADRRRRAARAGRAGGRRARAAAARAARPRRRVPPDLGAIATMRGGDRPEMLALARLACDVPDEIDDAPVFAAIRGLLDAFDAYSRRAPGRPAPADRRS